jgi:hypothetical protein
MSALANPAVNWTASTLRVPAASYFKRWTAKRTVVEKCKTITNSGAQLMPLYTEPEGQDFWLRPGETVEVRADVDSPAAADFEIEEGLDGVTVWPSHDMGYISTWSSGKVLECGYQRPKEQDLDAK